MWAGAQIASNADLNGKQASFNKGAPVASVGHKVLVCSIMGYKVYCEIIFTTWRRKRPKPK